MTLKLHCFGESGNSYKAALALELSGLEWEPIYVDFFGGEARSDDYRALNQMGEGYCNLMSGNLSEVCALRRFTGGHAPQ